MSGRPSSSHVLGRWAALAARRWRRVMAVALVAVAVLGGLVATYGGSFRDTFTVPGSDSQAAYDLLAERFPEAAGDTATVVLAASDGQVLEGPRRDAVEAALATITRQPHVVAVVSPLAEGGQGQVSQDGRVAFADVAYDQRADELGAAPTDALEDATRGLADAGIEVSLRGPVVDIGRQPPVLSAGELVGVVVAVVVLTLVLGSFAGMLVTLAVSFVSLGVALGLVLLAARHTSVPSTSVTLAVMLGLGVGIDYALLLAARQRENLAEDPDVVAAAARSNRTAGVAVVAAGLIVVVAISALLVVGIPYIGTMGVVTAATVAIVAAGAVLLTPAGLGAAGRRLAPRRSSAPSQSPSGGFARWVGLLVRRPLVPAIAAGAVLLGLAAPALGLRLGTPDDGVRSTTETQRIAYDHLARAFGPGINGPLLLAVALDPQAGAPDAVLERLGSAVAAEQGVAAVVPATLSPRGDAAVVTVIPTTAPQAAETSQLLERLRRDVLPRAVEGTGAVVHVGGPTASNDDLSDRIGARLPLFIGIVVLLAVLLLAAAFRSVRVPLVSALFNLLSVAAAYGLVVLVFQRGYGNELLGVEQTVPIVSFLPLFMFALLFGLSMDYNVFQQSRVREAFVSGPTAGNARASVAVGVTRTAPVILAAGAIMVAVFGSFLASPDVTVKMIAFGLAVAILVDVVLVRFVLAPAVTSLLGAGAWRMPRALDRVLPRLALEGAEETPAGPAASTTERAGAAR